MGNRHSLLLLGGKDNATIRLETLPRADADEGLAPSFYIGAIASVEPPDTLTFQRD